MTTKKSEHIELNEKRLILKSAGWLTETIKGDERWWANANDDGPKTKRMGLAAAWSVHLHRLSEGQKNRVRQYLVTVDIANSLDTERPTSYQVKNTGGMIRAALERDDITVTKVELVAYGEKVKIEGGPVVYDPKEDDE